MRIVAGIATFNKRNIQPTLNSLNTQVDKIYVYDNEIEKVDLTDNGKFIGLAEEKEPCYFFLCDDDIIYPPNYVKQTIQAIEKHKTIVTYHGRELRGLDRSYYRGHATFHFRHTQYVTKKIDVCGTGVTAFRTDYFNPVGLHLAEDKRMSDLIFSLEAAKQGKKITHLAHEGGWLDYIEQPKGTTIYEMENRNETRQIELANEIWKLKNKS
jgi:hypothetical protein